MLISLCTPIMNRLDDLEKTMPYRIAAADAHPPVEIVVVDYNSTDGLGDYIKELIDTTKLADGNFITYRLYTGRDTYHAAHANNLTMLLGCGEYVVLTPADVFIEIGYMKALRLRIDEGCVWCNTDRKRRSTIAIRKDEFIASGGYDERFEFYGPDDGDIIERLERRGGKRGVIPDEFLSDIFTPADKKVANYRIKVSHREMSKMLLPFYYENHNAGALVANVGQEWGKW